MQAPLVLPAISCSKMRPSTFAGVKDQLSGKVISRACALNSMACQHDVFHELDTAAEATRSIDSPLILQVRLLRRLLPDDDGVPVLVVGIHRCWYVCVCERPLGDDR